MTHFCRSEKLVMTHSDHQEMIESVTRIPGGKVLFHNDGNYRVAASVATRRPGNASFWHVSPLAILVLALVPAITVGVHVRPDPVIAPTSSPWIVPRQLHLPHAMMRPQSLGESDTTMRLRGGVDERSSTSEEPEWIEEEGMFKLGDFLFHSTVIIPNLHTPSSLNSHLGRIHVAYARCLMHVVNGWRRSPSLATLIIKLPTRPCPMHPTNCHPLLPMMQPNVTLTATWARTGGG